MLTCDNISYTSRFHGLGFSLTPGALLAIFGADATGVILLMAGKLKPTSGVIIFEEQPIARNRDYRELSLYIPLQYSFRPWETVEKAIKRLTKAGKGATELVEAALRYFALTEKRHERAKNLPKHLQKRIILSQLLTLPRPIWLLDHPEHELDTEGLGMLDALIANRCNQDGIVVVATTREGFMTPLPSLYLSDFK